MTHEGLSSPGRVTFETAAAHVCLQVPIVSPTACAGDIRQALIGQQYDSATHIVVCEDGRFLGLLRIEDLLAAPEESPAHALMDAHPLAVVPGVDQEVAAWRTMHHAASAGSCGYYGTVILSARDANRRTARLA